MGMTVPSGVMASIADTSAEASKYASFSMGCPFVVAVVRGDFSMPRAGRPLFNATKER